MVSYLRRFYSSVWNVLLKTSLDNILNFTAVFHSHIGRKCVPGKAGVAHWIGSWVSSRNCPGVLVKRKILASAGNRTTDRPEVWGHFIVFCKTLSGLKSAFSSSSSHQWIRTVPGRTRTDLHSRSIQESKNLCLLLTMPGKGTSFTDPVEVCWNLKKYLHSCLKELSWSCCSKYEVYNVTRENWTLQVVGTAHLIYFLWLLNVVSSLERKRRVEAFEKKIIERCLQLRRMDISGIFWTVHHEEFRSL